MALKDWKIESKMKMGGITYQHKKRKDYFLQVFYDFSHSNPWRFVVHADGRVIDETNFWTRGQAIKFANQYMRTH